MQSSAQRRAFPRYSLCCLCLVMIFTYGGDENPAISKSLSLGQDSSYVTSIQGGRGNPFLFASFFMKEATLPWLLPLCLLLQQRREDSFAPFASTWESSATPSVTRGKEIGLNTCAFPSELSLNGHP